MIFMSGGDQIAVMMVCDSKGRRGPCPRKHPVAAGHARDTEPPTLTGPWTPSIRFDGDRRASVPMIPYPRALSAALPVQAADPKHFSGG